VFYKSYTLLSTQKGSNGEKCGKGGFSPKKIQKPLSVDSFTHLPIDFMLVVRQFLSAFDAACWVVRAVHHNQNRVGFNKELRTDDIAAHLPYLQQLNGQGFHIFIRPKGHRYVLLDDLQREVLSAVAALQPCALVETSPQNYQAWLTLPEEPQHDAAALQVCRSLAVRFGADLGSAKPQQLGRLPGFENRKLKYEQNGYFPLVRLHRFQQRTACVEMDELLQDAPPVIFPKIAHGGKSKGRDRSGYDFALACFLIDQGRTDAQIFDILQRKSEKAVTRRDAERYLKMTIAKARGKKGG
jgi:hypothetical protein